MIVSKLDFSIVEFSQNIEDKKIFPYIIEEDEEKIKPFLGDDLHSAIRSISDTNPVAWNATTSYLLGKYATNQGATPSPDDKMYRAIQPSINQSLSNAAYWVEDALGTFYLNYIKPFAVFVIYQKFLLWHGNNVWQSGMGTNYSETSSPIDGQTRSQLISDAKNRAQTRKNRIENYLCDVNYTIDGVKYEVDCKKYKKTNDTIIRAVGKKPTRRLRDNGDW